MINRMTRRRSRAARSRALDVSKVRHVEPMERRVLLSGGPEPATLLEELVLPGDLSIGAAPFAQHNPYVAPGPDGTSLAVWTDYRTGGHPNLLWGPGNGTTADIWAARIAADGSLIDQIPIAVNNDDWHQTGAKAAWNGSGWLIAWNSKINPSYEQIHAARLSAQGEVLDPDPIVIMDNRFLDEYGNPTSPVGPLDVEPAGNHFVVTWWRTEREGSSINKVIYGTRVLDDGTIPPSDLDGRRLHSGPYSYTNWLGLAYSASNGGQLLQAFEYNGTIYTVRRNPDLSLIDTTFTTQAGTGVIHWESRLVGSPDGWMLSFKDGVGVAALRLTSSNTYIDLTPLRVASVSQPQVSATFDGTGYVAIYTSYTATGNIFGRRIPTSGPMAEPVLLKSLGNPVYDVNGTGVGGGTYDVLFSDSTGGTTDIALVRVAPDNTTSGVADVSNAARTHTAPQIASDGTNSLAVFRSFNADTGEIKGVRLTTTGQALDPEPFIIVPSSLSPGAPNIVFFQGRYVVVFKGNGPAGNILYGQQVGTDGQLVGAPVALTGGMGNGEVSVLGNRLLLTGLSSEGLLHRSFRFARIFDESLAPVTDRFELSYGFTGGGSVATVGGRWLLAYGWKSTHDAPRSGIAYTYVSPDGTFTPPQALVSTYPDNGGVAVVSAGENASEAMIIFQRWDLPPELGGPFWFPNSNEGLVGQRMGADGTRIGGLITIVDQPGTSGSPRATFDGSNYVVTWVDTRNGQYPQQEIPDVFAARVSIDGTVLDPGGFAVADRHAPEDSVVAVAGAGHTYFAYRSFRYEKPWASYRITTRLLDDPHAPTSSREPLFDVNGPAAQTGPNVGTSFWERLFGVSGGDLVLLNTTTGQTIDPASLATVERVGAAGRWEYDWIHNGGALPDGNYTATLPAGSVLDKAGNPLADDLTFEFFFLNGDANHDGRVNLDDFNILAANFGGTEKTFSQGDFNYDGVVNLDDFNILASRFGTTLSPSGTLTTGPGLPPAAGAGLGGSNVGARRIGGADEQTDQRDSVIDELA